MDQKSHPTVSIQLDVEQQEILQYALSLSDTNCVEEFVMNAAFEKAEKVIDEYQSIRLSPVVTSEEPANLELKGEPGKRVALAAVKRVIKAHHKEIKALADK